MQTNAALRKQAWKTYIHNRRQLWTLFLIFTVLTTGRYALQRYFLPAGSLSSVIYQLCSFVVMPFTTFGLDLVLLRLIRKKKTTVAMGLDPLRAPFHPLKTYAASTVLILPTLAITFFTVLDLQAPETITLTQLIVQLILILGIIILGIWVSLRLFLFPYLFVTQPDAGIWELLKTSFQKMKGQVRHLLWFVITVTFPVAIVVIVMIVLFFNNIYQPNIAQTALTVFLISNALVSLFVLPYFYLAYTAFANNLLLSKH